MENRVKSRKIIAVVLMIFVGAICIYKPAEKNLKLTLRLT